MTETKVWKKYEGECEVCHTRFTATSFPTGEEVYPDAWDFECPIPWCGLVKMRVIGHIAIDDSGAQIQSWAT